jgi:curved DNA-binding protein CbpA
MQELLEDYYAILGVEEKATPDDIRKAYLKLAKKLHPDRFPNDPEKREAAQLEFSKVTRAHEVLGDQRQREEYDGFRLLRKTRQEGAVPEVKMTPEQRTENKENWAVKHSARAKECIAKKRYEEAETAIKEAIRLDPNKSTYHCQLAELYIVRGWKTMAMTETQAALRLDPKDNEAKQLEVKLKASPKGKDDKKGSSGFFGLFKK